MLSLWLCTEVTHPGEAQQYLRWSSVIISQNQVTRGVSLSTSSCLNHESKKSPPGVCNIKKTSQAIDIQSTYVKAAAVALIVRIKTHAPYDSTITIRTPVSTISQMAKRSIIEREANATVSAKPRAAAVRRAASVASATARWYPKESLVVLEGYKKLRNSLPMLLSVSERGGKAERRTSS